MEVSLDDSFYPNGCYKVGTDALVWKPLPASPKGRRRFTRASWDRYFRLEIAPQRGCLEDISTYQRGKWGIVRTYDTYCFRL